MKVLSPAATAWLAYPKDKMHVPTCIPLFSYWIVSSEESEVKDTEKTLWYMPESVIWHITSERKQVPYTSKKIKPCAKVNL